MFCQNLLKTQNFKGSFDRKANSEDPDLTVLHCLKRDDGGLDFIGVLGQFPLNCSLKKVIH